MKNFLSRYSIQSIVVALFVITACFVVILRSLSPLALNSDASVQIGAALSLLNGDGLGTYILNQDVSQPPKLNPLTWYAPGFSLVLFGLLKIGLPLAIALKLMYAIASIVGWFGWGLIWRDVMRSQLQTAASKGVAILLAVLLPFYFTYDWVGTDLFLWAGIPFIIRLFYLSAAPESKDRSFWIGCLIGLMYTFRYAAIFIIVGVCLFFLIRRNNFIKLGKILLGFGLFYGAVSIYRAVVSTSVPSQLTLAGSFQTDALFRKLFQIAEAFRQVKFLLFSHLSDHVPGGRFLTPIVLSVLLVYASILIWGYPSSKEKKVENARLEIILCLNVGLVIFLALISFVSSIDFIYLADQRYYYPLFPSFVLVANEIGFKLPQNRLNRDGILRIISLVFLGSFVFLAASMFLRVPDRVFGFDRFDAKVYITQYPSNAIRNRHPESYQATIELLKQNPQAIAISFAENFDFWHLPDTAIRKRILPASYLKQRFLSTHTSSKDLQVYLIFGIESNCQSYCYYDSGKTVDLMKQVPSPKLVYVNEKEKIRILSTKLPKGLKFTFALQ